MEMLELTLGSLGLDGNATPNEVIGKVFDFLELKGHEAGEFRGAALELVSEYGVYCVNSEGVFVVDLTEGGSNSVSTNIKVSIECGLYVGNRIHDPIAELLVKVGDN